jgi:hypothetical protein
MHGNVALADREDRCVPDALLKIRVDALEQVIEQLVLSTL